MQVFMRHAVEHGAAVVMHQGLGQAGGATRIHNPQRVVEWHPQGRERMHRCIVPLHDLRPIGAVGHRRLIAQVAVNHHMLHTGQGLAQFADHRVPL